MIHSFFKHFSTTALALATLLLIFVMFQLVGVISGSSQLDLLVHSHVEVLVLNSVGVVLLFAWIGVYVYQIYKEYRRKVPGTQLAMRILRNIALITFFSMAVVYVFSFLALSRGIDNWFALQVGEAVEEATQLRVMIFDSFESNIRNDLRDVVEELATLVREQESQDFNIGISEGAVASGESGGELGLQLGEVNFESQETGLVLGSEAMSSRSTLSVSESADNLRSSIFRLIFDASQSIEYEEVTYFEDLTSPEGMVVSSSSRTGSLLPVQPSQRLIEQLFLESGSRQSLDVRGSQDASETVSERDQSWRARRSSWELLAGNDGNTLLRMLIPIPIADQTQRHYLQVLTNLPASSLRLAERVSQMKERHERLEYLRNPLKFSFVLALTYVTLMAVLLATWAAIGLTRRLVEPIRTLSEGTKAVAKGQYEALEEVDARDDLSVLVESFNEMIRRIKESQEKISHSQLLAEKQNEHLEIVLKHLSSGVMFIDKNERLNNINLATEKILQVRADEVKNSRIRDMINHQEKYTPLFVSIAKAIDRKVSDWSETVRLETEQGEQILSYSVTELPVTDSKAATHVVVIEDITALVQAQRGVAWREVARRMAHEMLNPLQPIQLAVERIQYKTNAHLSEDQSRSLELSFAAISRQLNTLHRIVKEFQDYSKPVVLRKTKLSMNKLIREVITLHEKNERIEEIQLDLEPELTEIQGDPDKLVQVFNNLINNAREAMKEPAQVVVKIRTRTNEAGNIDVWVIDNGPGFESDVFDRMFEPYATTKKQGMGFGLEIVKRIVEAHGGTVTAKNNPDGIGAQIQLQFGVNMARPTIQSDVISVGNSQQEAQS